MDCVEKLKSEVFLTSLSNPESAAAGLFFPILKIPNFGVFYSFFIKLSGKHFDLSDSSSTALELFKVKTGRYERYGIYVT